jgi:hypothetical protein
MAKEYVTSGEAFEDAATLIKTTAAAGCCIIS